MAVMALLRRSPLSVYGLSVAGAAAHQTGQVLAAVLLLGSWAPLSYLPLLWLASLVTGCATGCVTALLCRAFSHVRPA